MGLQLALWGLLGLSSSPHLAQPQFQDTTPHDRHTGVCGAPIHSPQACVMPCKPAGQRRCPWLRLPQHVAQRARAAPTAPSPLLLHVCPHAACPDLSPPHLELLKPGLQVGLQLVRGGLAVLTVAAAGEQQPNPNHRSSATRARLHARHSVSVLLCEASTVCAAE